MSARQHELDVLIRERVVMTQDLDFLGETNPVVYIVLGPAEY